MENLYKNVKLIFKILTFLKILYLSNRISEFTNIFILNEFIFYLI